MLGIRSNSQPVASSPHNKLGKLVLWWGTMTFTISLYGGRTLQSSVKHESRSNQTEFSPAWEEETNVKLGKTNHWAHKGTKSERPIKQKPPQGRHDMRKGHVFRQKLVFHCKVNQWWTWRRWLEDNSTANHKRAQQWTWCTVENLAVLWASTVEHLAVELTVH